MIIEGVGRLVLTVVEAKLTRSTEYWGKMDPQVEINYPDAKRTKTWRSKVSTDTHLTPVWNESVAVDVKRLAGYLVLKMWDSDYFGDEFIG